MKDERLHRYFDGEMPADERAAFEAEMTDEDRAKLATLAQSRALLIGALDAEAAGADVWQAVEARLRPARRAPGRRWGGRPLVGASAGLLLAAAALLVFLRPPAAPLATAWAVKRLDVRGASVAIVAADEGETPVIWTTEED